MYKLINDLLTGQVSYVLKNNILHIPFDPANTDYQKYLAWLEAGNTPLPADSPLTEDK